MRVGVACALGSVLIFSVLFLAPWSIVIAPACAWGIASLIPTPPDDGR